MPKDKEQNGDTSGKTEAEQGTRETMDTLDSGLHYKATTKLLLLARKDAILIVCDKLSKMTHFVTTTEETSAEGLARLFKDNV